jgi:HlyD family secretion protein
MWKWIAALIAALVVVIVAARVLGSAAPVEIAAVRRGTVEATVDERAVTRLPRTVVVAAPIEGRAGPALVREGQRVQAGETLVLLATDDMERAVALALARVADLDAQLAAHADNRIEELVLEQSETLTEVVERAQEAAVQQTRASRARIELATEERQRVEQAFEQGSSNELEVLRARADEIQSDAEARADEITLQAVEASLVAARILPRIVRQYIERKQLTRQSLLRQREAAAVELAQAEADLARAEIRAPVAGVVLAADHQSERWVAAGSPLVELGQLEDLEVEAEILTERAAAIEPGQAAVIYGGAASEARIPARVDRIYPRGFEERSALGVQQQRVLVIVRPHGGHEGLEPAAAEAWRRLGVAYRVRVRITTARAEDVMVAPRAAVFPGAGGGWAVLRVEGGRARRAPVTVGLIGEEFVGISEGLSAGDEVIVAPPADLREGARVRPVR